MQISNRKKIFFSLLGVIFVVFLGNLAGFFELIKKIQQKSDIFAFFEKTCTHEDSYCLTTFASFLGKFTEYLGYSYWDPTRVIPGTINEFPFFSFLFADLHPHMIAIPFTIFVLALLINYYLAGFSTVVGRNNIASSLSNDNTSNDCCIKKDGDTLNSLPLPLSLQRALQSANINSLSHLASLTPKELLSIPHIGEKSVKKIQEALKGTSTTLPLDNKTPRLMHSLPSLCLIGFSMGLLFPTNAWDFPVYVLLALVIFLLKNNIQSELFRFFSESKEPLKNQRADKGCVASIFRICLHSLLELIIVVVVAYGSYYPFHANFVAPVQGFGFNDTYTHFRDFLLLFGFFLFILYCYLISQSKFFISFFSKLLNENWHDILIIAAFWGLLLSRFWSLQLFLAITLFLLTLELLRYKEESFVNIALVFFLVALSITLGTEFIYIKDHLQGGAMKRMNTVFKFYNQAWIFFALGSALILPVILKKLSPSSFIYSTLGKKPCSFENDQCKNENIKHMVISNSGTTDHGFVSSETVKKINLRKTLFLLSLCILFFMSLTYPIFGTVSRVRDRFDDSLEYPEPTLDSLAFMKYGRFNWEGQIELSYELDAIEWLNANVIGNPVIVEAGGFLGFYREMGGRVSSLTGLPTLNGTHQNEQRDVLSRPTETRDIYTLRSWEGTKKLIDKYRVEYIYIGQIERNALKETFNEEKFQDQVGKNLEVAYQNEKTIIYRVKPQQ